MRIVADHLRTATFILGDERAVTPSNVDQGYVLRRLIRRAVRFGLQLGAPAGFTAQVAEQVVHGLCPHLRGAAPQPGAHHGRTRQGGGALCPHRAAGPAGV